MYAELPSIVLGSVVGDASVSIMQQLFDPAPSSETGAGVIERAALRDERAARLRATLAVALSLIAMFALFRSR